MLGHLSCSPHYSPSGGARRKLYNRLGLASMPVRPDTLSMKPVAIVTDSTSDLPTSVAEPLGIHIIPCNVHFGTEVYRERIDLTNDEFYQRLANSPQLPKTSQPASGVFEELYRQL